MFILTDQISDFTISSSDKLISSDMFFHQYSNFRSTAETTSHIQTNKSQHIMELMKYCLTSTYFTYNNNFYKQIGGAPMGLSLIHI